MSDAIPPSPHFKPVRLILPLEKGLVATAHAETQAWVDERIAKGDPGPLFVENGEMWTEQSLSEEN